VTPHANESPRLAWLGNPGHGKDAGPGRGLLADLLRYRAELLAENAFLRQQLLLAAPRIRIMPLVMAEN
jgi:hypothetical protein